MPMIRRDTDVIERQSPDILRVGRVSPMTNVLTTHDLPITDDQWQRFMSGALVQDALPDLTSEQREFVLTGYTPEDWEQIFPPDPEEQQPE